MNRLILLLSIMVLTGIGCMPKLSEIHKSSECQDYYQLFKTDWVKKEGYYQFKGDPQFLEDSLAHSTYFKPTCIMGLHRKKLNRMLGEPTKESHIPNGFKLVYCLNIDCSRKLQIYTDSIGYVQATWLNPAGLGRD